MDLSQPAEPATPHCKTFDMVRFTAPPYRYCVGDATVDKAGANLPLAANEYSPINMRREIELIRKTEQDKIEWDVTRRER